jgi:hypothetical protein
MLDGGGGRSRCDERLGEDLRLRDSLLRDVGQQLGRVR